jgi:hypothetical protein
VSKVVVVKWVSLGCRDGWTARTFRNRRFAAIIGNKDTFAKIAANGGASDTNDAGGLCVRPFPKRMSSWVLLLLLGGVMSAQPAVTVHDSLSEVRIFDHTSPDFAKAASDLGVSASLATLGEGLPLVVAVRNDSGEDMESARILYEGGRTTQVVLHGSLAKGAGALIGPPELQRALSALMNRQQGLGVGQGPAQSLASYQGAEITVSVDSASLASGRFVGPDTWDFLPQLIELDNAKKAFFRQVAGFRTSGLSQPLIEAALTDGETKARATKSQARLSIVAVTEAGWYRVALGRLRQFGMASLFTWADGENAKVASKPALHR